MSFKDQVKAKRDAKLRYKLLFVLYETASSSPTGFIEGRLLKDHTDMVMPEGQRFEDDEHALSMIRHLRQAGLVEEKPFGDLRAGERFRLEHVRFGITEAGIALYEQRSPPHRLVDDGRVMREGV